MCVKQKRRGGFSWKLQKITLFYFWALQNTHETGHVSKKLWRIITHHLFVLKETSHRNIIAAKKSAVWTSFSLPPCKDDPGFIKSSPEDKICYFRADRPTEVWLTSSPWCGRRGWSCSCWLKMITIWRNYTNSVSTFLELGLGFLGPSHHSFQLQRKEMLNIQFGVCLRIAKQVSWWGICLYFWEGSLWLSLILTKTNLPKPVGKRWLMNKGQLE